MSMAFSPHIEQKISEALAGGLYPSREALLEAGVEKLFADPVPPIPDEHMDLVEAAMESSRAGHSAVMTNQEWEQLRRGVRDIAAEKNLPLD